MSEITESRDKLMADLKAVVSDADDLLKITADNANEKISEARAQIKDRLDAVKDRIAASEVTVAAKHAAQTADTFVHNNPWKSIGVAAGVGLIVGLLIGRR